MDEEEIIREHFFFFLMFSLMLSLLPGNSVEVAMNTQEELRER